MLVVLVPDDKCLKLPLASRPNISDLHYNIRSTVSPTATPTPPAHDCFTTPVGISDQNKIPDNQMTASSYFGTSYQPAYGRLYGNRGDGWCAKDSNKNGDWLQVDLGTAIEVCAIATQGDINGNEWVTDFKLSYSSDGQTWKPYKDANGTEVVRGYIPQLEYWFSVTLGHVTM